MGMVKGNLWLGMFKGRIVIGRYIKGMVKKGGCNWRQKIEIVDYKKYDKVKWSTRKQICGYLI